MKQLFVGLMVLVLIAACGKEPRTTDELRKAGEKAFLDGKYAKARDYFGRAVAEKPSDRHLLYMLGISYQRDYLYDSAYHYLKRADLLFPRDREINLALYEISKAVEEWKGAIQAINQLVQTGDPVEKYYGELVELNLRVENYPVAYAYARRALESRPPDPNTYLQVANLAAELDSPRVAIQVIDSAIELFGPSDEFSLNKALYFTVLRRYDEAETILRSVLQKDATAIAYRLNLANTLASQNDPGKKREAYRLYRELRSVAGDQFRIDSMIAVLRDELNITQ
jgi:tetratricopeptide (TPR) repeat protein